LVVEELKLTRAILPWYAVLIDRSPIFPILAVPTVDD